MRLAALLSATAIAFAVPAVVSAQAVDRVAINRIIDQGFNHSEVMETAAWLTDRIGGRMTNSPRMRQAEAWTQQRFRDWGLSNVRADPFEFGRGWSVVRASARMIEPRPLDLRVIPVAWTPGTDGGEISGEVVVAPMTNPGDFAAWRGKLGGKIVMMTKPDTGSEPTEPFFRRWTDEELRDRNTYVLPNHSEPSTDRLGETEFALRLDEFLAEEGALAWVRMSYRDGGLLHGAGYTHRVGATPTVPGFELAAEDYRRLARLSKTDATPILELMSEVRFHDEDVNAYNVLADIPGTDRSGEYVMAGAHFDSWAASDGAVDNAAGTAVVMEAARILRAMGVRPKRTIRFALWNGEEQGLHGSLAYVDKYLATRAPLGDPELDALPNNRTWRQRWPIQPRPGYGDLVAYFNLDNGSGKIRGINAEGNIAAAPIFEAWLEPFDSMGASTVSLRPSGGTDHVYMQTVGIPGYQFIQDPLDYGSRLHHTSIDSYDHLRPADLRQAAVILASFLLNAANSDEPLPRMPMPTRPRPTDPFAW
ncbi:MAG: M20/M25/M40 family metallo-hydrolase [Brevundimonas sp.]|uniref:M20/M25/M40 family metallo-hydrolase n=1 Tax=Brevundimonas sp. TaxID=1871086 RepID=UPI002639BD59|nr:M20/M25/M40 family metallo-hydrolase [Brevundimonas sp.]MDI6625529.1 M20/M25/M40 family metallo-hydrolase [Brevundimonas sp.]MDQ7813440.1 M20/M25/M40 family metallo-hydrolase [Brevundimonas sp.]